jgi:hypothetical protein
VKRTRGEQRVDDEKEGRPRGPKRGKWKGDTRQQGKGGPEDDKAGEWPTLAKHGAAEKGGVVQATLIWARRSRSSKIFILDSGPPPLRLKVERRGGPEWSSSSLIRAR